MHTPEGESDWKKGPYNHFLKEKGLGLKRIKADEHIFDGDILSGLRTVFGAGVDLSNIGLDGRVVKSGVVTGSVRDMLMQGWRGELLQVVPGSTISTHFYIMNSSGKVTKWLCTFAYGAISVNESTIHVITQDGNMQTSNDYMPIFAGFKAGGQYEKVSGFNADKIDRLITILTNTNRVGFEEELFHSFAYQMEDGRRLLPVCISISRVNGEHFSRMDCLHSSLLEIKQELSPEPKVMRESLDRLEEVASQIHPETVETCRLSLEEDPSRYVLMSTTQRIDIHTIQRDPRYKELFERLFRQGVLPYTGLKLPFGIKVYISRFIADGDGLSLISTECLDTAKGVSIYARGYNAALFAYTAAQSMLGTALYAASSTWQTLSGNLPILGGEGTRPGSSADDLERRLPPVEEETARTFSAAGGGSRKDVEEPLGERLEK